MPHRGPRPTHSGEQWSDSRRQRARADYEVAIRLLVEAAEPLVAIRAAARGLRWLLRAGRLPATTGDARVAQARFIALIAPARRTLRVAARASRQAQAA